MTYDETILRRGLICGAMLAVLSLCEWAMAANC